MRRGYTHRKRRPHKPVTISNGYRYVYMPEHPNANYLGRVREHRLIVERRIGRLLTREEVVHHKNRDRADNADDNLELLADRVHRQLHTTKHACCQRCGRSHHARGLCSGCYAKEWRAGSLEASAS